MLNRLLPLNPLSLLAALALSAVGTASLLPAAEAALFNFSYTLESGDIVSGMMEGDIQANGDTVFVTAVTMPVFEGAPAPALPFVSSMAEMLIGTPTPATVSFSGSTMDFAACDSPACDDGFMFTPPGLSLPVAAFGGGPSYGDSWEEYNSDNWSLTEKQPCCIPEPTATFGLVALGIFGAASRRKRK